MQGRRGREREASEDRVKSGGRETGGERRRFKHDVGRRKREEEEGERGGTGRKGRKSRGRKREGTLHTDGVFLHYFVLTVFRIRIDKNNERSCIVLLNFI